MAPYAPAPATTTPAPPPVRALHSTGGHGAAAVRGRRAAGVPVTPRFAAPADSDQAAGENASACGLIQQTGQDIAGYVSSATAYRPTLPIRTTQPPISAATSRQSPGALHAPAKATSPRRPTSRTLPAPANSSRQPRARPGICPPARISVSPPSSSPEPRVLWHRLSYFNVETQIPFRRTARLRVAVPDAAPGSSGSPAGRFP
jgi:hypothetical protein